MKTPDQQFEDCLVRILDEKDINLHASHCGYASGFAAALLINGIIDSKKYTEYIDKIIALIQSQITLRRMGAKLGIFKGDQP